MLKRWIPKCSLKAKYLLLAHIEVSSMIEYTYFCIAGRPRRQLKGFFAGETSSSKVEISTRQQFSRIQDLVTVSDSD